MSDDEPTPHEQRAMAMTADMISVEITDLLEAFDDIAFAGTVLSITLSRLLIDYPDSLAELAYKTHTEQARKCRAFLKEQRAKGGKH